MLANHKVLTKIDLQERHCTCSRLWLKSAPNVKLSRLLGRVKPFQALVESKFQALKTAGRGHPFQALVEMLSKCQVPQAAWQGHSLQALGEIIPKCQVFKAFWQKLQTHDSCYTCYLRNPFDSNACIGGRGSLLLYRTPCCINICWNISAGKAFASLPEIPCSCNDRWSTSWVSR